MMALVAVLEADQMMIPVVICLFQISVLRSLMKIYEIFPDYSRKSIDVMHNLTSKNIEQTVNTSLDTTPAKILYLMNNQN